MTLSFEEPADGADDFAIIRARGAHKVYGNEEARHSLKALIADIPLERCEEEK